jgi:hypothetical protein
MEAKAIGVVRRWYVMHGNRIPDRMLIGKVLPDKYVIFVGPEHIEIAFEVDRNSLEILKIWPGQ